MYTLKNAHGVVVLKKKKLIYILLGYIYLYEIGESGSVFKLAYQNARSIEKHSIWQDGNLIMVFKDGLSVEYNSLWEICFEHQTIRNTLWSMCAINQGTLSDEAHLSIKNTTRLLKEHLKNLIELAQ